MNEVEEKEIEEMARTMGKCKKYKNCEDCIETYKKVLDKKAKLKDCELYYEATTLYNAGYRKLPEDSVVLSREEYEKLKMFKEGHITCEDTLEFVEKWKYWLIEDGSVDVEDLAQFIEEHNLKIKIVIYRQGAIPPELKAFKE